MCNLFCFFKQKTAYEMRISDWSSDVCSSNLKAGGSKWNNSINLRIGSEGSGETVDWDGCIEERKTISRSSYDPIPTEAMDLNIDLVPDRTDQDTLWGPALPDLVFARQRTYSWNQIDRKSVGSGKSVSVSVDLG